MNGSYDIVTYDSPLHLNNGVAMDSATGIFTSPLTGLYYFSFTGVKPKESPLTIVQMVRKTNLLQQEHFITVGMVNTTGTNPLDELFVPVHCQATLFLNVGDLVYVKLIGDIGVVNPLVDGDFITYRGTTTFTGFLLQTGTNSVRKYILKCHKIIHSATQDYINTLQTLDYQTFFYNVQPYWATGDSFHNCVDAKCMDNDTATQIIKNSNLDKKTNTFTAQFKGVYFFTYSLSTSTTGGGTGSSTVAILQKNDKEVSVGLYHSGSSTISKYRIDIKAMLILEPGDKVSIVQLDMDNEHIPDVIDESLHLELSHGTFNGFQLSSLH